MSGCYTEKLRTVLEPFPGKYTIIRRDGSSILLLALPYTPRKAETPGTGFVDSYYEAYQQIFRRKNEIVRQWAESGFPPAENVAENYPRLAASCGFAELLRNGLAMIPGYGTFFTMEALKLPEMEGVREGELCRGSLCKACRLCREKCPVSCIADSPDGSRCLREVQKKGMAENMNLFLLMKNRVLGCNTCQRCCPYNAGFPASEAPERFRLDRLFLAAAGGRKTLEPYADVFGKNYLRPKWLLSLIISAMAQTPCKEYDDLVFTLHREKDPRVFAALQRYWALSNIGDCQPIMPVWESE